MMQALSHSTVRRLVVAGLALATVVAAVALTISLVPTDESTPTPGVTSPSGIAADEPPSTAPSTANGSTPTSAPFVAAPTPAPSGPRTTTEVEQGGTTDPGPLAVAPLPPLMTGRIPANASALDRIVAGFPSVMPLAAQSTVLTSSISSSGTRLQATLDATSELSPTMVADFYRSAFAALSLAGSDVPATEGSIGMIFSRGRDSVTLTVTPRGDGTRYSLFGVLDVTP